MPRDRRNETDPATTDGLSVGQRMARLATEIVELDPGSAAALRREARHGAEAAAFWKLFVKHGRDLKSGDEDGWRALIQAIAILTPKGRHNDERPRPSAHDPYISMGSTLHDAGVSEIRLARLLTAPLHMRRTLTVRLCRRLASAEQRRFNLKTLAEFILYGNAGRRIARDYYRAQAMAGRQLQSEEN